MALKPFLKWAGGKRWLTERKEFSIPAISGRYIEPFLGGAAVFFHVRPRRALLSDTNIRLVETYRQIQQDWQAVWALLLDHQKRHSPEHYYDERVKSYSDGPQRAAQFIYLNRTCWNGLYRENLRGEFNVPIGTKSTVVFADDDFGAVAEALSSAEIRCCDFAETISLGKDGDFLFVDPPYTTAHNMNGFIKYNQNIFRWEDQLRLRDSLISAADRGSRVLLTNADHPSIHDLYIQHSSLERIERPSVISGSGKGRHMITEAIIRIGYNGLENQC